MAGIQLGLIGSFPSAALGSYDSIATVAVGASPSATITFSGIPATYSHLQLRYIARNADASTTVNMTAQLNSDTGANYAWHRLLGTGAVAQAGNSTTQSNIIFAQTEGTLSTASVFGVGVLDILDYANTGKNTTTRALIGLDINGSGYIQLFSGLWMNTAAVSTLVISCGTLGFSQYSHFALYGIK